MATGVTRCGMVITMTFKLLIVQRALVYEDIIVQSSFALQTGLNFSTPGAMFPVNSCMNIQLDLVNGHPLNSGTGCTLFSAASLSAGGQKSLQCKPLSRTCRTSVRRSHTA